MHTEVNVGSKICNKKYENGNAVDTDDLPIEIMRLIKDKDLYPLLDLFNNVYIIINSMRTEIVSRFKYFRLIVEHKIDQTPETTARI